MILSMTVYNLIFKASNWIQNAFSEDIFKYEYLELLKIGAILGYILVIIFLFMLQYTQLARLSKIKKNPLLLMMILHIFITTIAIILPIINHSLEWLIISFSTYIIFFISMELMKEYLTHDDQFKNLHSI